MTTAQAQPPKQTEMPPRLVVTPQSMRVLNKDQVARCYPLGGFFDGTIKEGDTLYLSFTEHNAAIQRARRELWGEAADVIRGFQVGDNAEQYFRDRAEKEKL